MIGGKLIQYQYGLKWYTFIVSFTARQMKINRVNKLYHGTDQEFDVFDFSFAKSFKDFGKGFYLTSNFWQAQKWAQNKGRMKTKTYIYSYDISLIDESKWNILELFQYDKKWVDFITDSRMMGKESEYDIIYDRIADNQFTEISEILRSYSNSEINVDKVIERIKWNNDSADQYCFKNERALSLLKDRQVIIQYKDDMGRWKQVRG